MLTSLDLWVNEISLVFGIALFYSQNQQFDIFNFLLCWVVQYWNADMTLRRFYIYFFNTVPDLIPSFILSDSFYFGHLKLKNKMLFYHIHYIYYLIVMLFCKNWIFSTVCLSEDFLSTYLRLQLATVFSTTFLFPTPQDQLLNLLFLETSFIKKL